MTKDTNAKTLERNLIQYLIRDFRDLVDNGFKPVLMENGRDMSRVRVLHDYVSDQRGRDDKAMSEATLRYQFSWLRDIHFDDPTLDAQTVVEELARVAANHIHRTTTLELANADVDDPARLADIYSEFQRRFDSIRIGDTHQLKGDKFVQVLIDKRSRKKTSDLGHSLGFAEIDEHTGGLQPGHLAIVTALPKRQKSWILVKAFVQQIIDGNRPIFFSLELSNEDILGRAACLMTGVSFARFYANDLLPHEWKKVNQAAQDLSESSGIISNPPFGSRYVSNLFQEVEQTGSTSIIIDQFSFLNFRNGLMAADGYKDIIYDLKNRAQVHGVPVLMAAQQNRDSDGEKFPKSQTIGLTRAVEEASDLIMGIQITDASKIDSQLIYGVVDGRYCEGGPEARWAVGYEFREDTTLELLGQAGVW